MTTTGTSKSAIGGAVIDPSAEEISKAPAMVSAKQEVAFFDAAKAEHERQTNRQNLGQLGAFFGANSSTPTHIAGAIAFISFILLAITLGFPEAAPMRELRSGLMGIVGSAMGYIFGASSKK